MAKMKRFQLNDPAARIDRKRVSKLRTKDIRSARAIKNAQFGGMK